MPHPVDINGIRIITLRASENSAGACGFMLMAYLEWWGIGRQRWNGRTGDNFHFRSWEMGPDGVFPVSPLLSISGLSGISLLARSAGGVSSISGGTVFGFRLGCTNTVFRDERLRTASTGVGS